LQKNIYKIWKDADNKGERYLPHEFMYKMLFLGVLEEYYEIDLKDSWMYAAAEKKLTNNLSRMGRQYMKYFLLHMLLRRFKSFYGEI
jgi:hypothetical protein